MMQIEEEETRLKPLRNNEDTMESDEESSSSNDEHNNKIQEMLMKDIIKSIDTYMSHNGSVVGVKLRKSQPKIPK